MSKSRMIGIKVADKSDLPERLKALSKGMEMEYAELIEKWVSAEEKNGSKQLPLFPEEDGERMEFNQKLNQKEGNLTAFEDIKERMVKLESRYTGIESQIQLNGKLNQTAAATFPPPDIEARLGEIEKVIADLTTKLEAGNVAPVQPIEGMVTRPKTSREDKPRKSAPETAPERELKSYEIRIIELSKMVNENGKKLSTRAIAEKLEVEGVLSEKGLSKWSSGNVSDYQKKLRDRGLFDS